jgi:hypothetical protein
MIVAPGLSLPAASASVMIPYAARSFTDPPGFMNSAFPRISHPVSSDRHRNRINGVFPTYPSMPEYLAVI